MQLSERPRIGRPPKYPWRTLEVGESFLAPEKFTETRQISGTAFHAGQRAERQFSLRLVMLQGKRRVRVFRVR